VRSRVPKLPPEDPSRSTPPENPNGVSTPLYPTEEDLIRVFMEATGRTREEAITFHGDVLKHTRE